MPCVRDNNLIFEVRKRLMPFFIDKFLQDIPNSIIITGFKSVKCAVYFCELMKYGMLC